MIRLSGVSYTYPHGERPAIKNISLGINGNEFIAIMGRNGSGKSTLARLLNGLLLPGQGDVSVDGLSSSRPENLLPIRKKVGLLFPDPDSQLLANLVEEEVAFGPENLGLEPAEIRNRVDTALKMVSMEDYIKYPPYLLSGGQKQRICMASLLAMQPDYLILDEPFSMLDPRGRKDLLTLLKKMREQQGITLVLITHSLEEAMQAEQIIIVDNGQIHTIGAPADIMTMGAQLTQLGIEPLEISNFIGELNRNPGVKIPADITDIESLVDILCPFS